MAGVHLTEDDILTSGGNVDVSFNASTGTYAFNADVGDVSVAGADGAVQLNDLGILGASEDLVFDGSSLITSGVTLKTGGVFDMDFIADVPTTVNVQHSNSGSFILTWFVIAENADGLLTARAGDGRQNLPAPDAGNPVEVTWQQRPDAEKYYVVVEQFDLSTFTLTNRVIDEITDTSVTVLTDTGQGVLLANSGLSTIPTQNETYGRVFLAPRRLEQSQTGGLLMSEDGSGEVARTPLDLARYEGDEAFTFGQRDPTEPIGSGSFAAGRSGLIATGRASIALGENVEARSTGAVAMGSGCIATGEGAFAAGQATQATDENAFAVGVATQATQFNAVAEGNQTISSGSASHAEGFLTQALGTSSHSEGSNSLARGRSSHAGGDETVAWPYASRVVGFFNEDYLGGLSGSAPPVQNGIEDFDSLADRIFAVGVGGDPQANPGDRDYIDGRGRVDGLYVTVREGTHIRHGLSVDSYNDSLGEYETELSLGPEISSGTDASQVLVRNPNTNELEYVDGSTLGGGGGANIEAGLGLSSTLNASTGITTFDVDPAESNTESDVLLLDASTGELLTLNDGSSLSAKYEGSGAFTFGRRTGLAGQGSVVFGGRDGRENEASGGESVAFGIESVASGFFSIAAGTDSVASGSRCVAGGLSATASGFADFAWGQNVTTTGNYSAAFNVGTTAGQASLAGGNGSSALGSISLAFGEDSDVWGTNSAAIGTELIQRAGSGVAVGALNEDYLGPGSNQSILDEINPSDRVFQVGVGDPSGSGVLSGSGRLDGLYVTWREGTHIRHGLSLDAYNTSSGEYETELSIPERIQSGGDTSQVLVRNPSTNELEYVPGSALGGGGGSTSITDGVGIDVDYNASTDSFVVSVSDVVAKAVDFGGPVRVTSGEIEVTTPGLGNVVRSPDGTRFRVKVKNDGTIVSEQL